MNINLTKILPAIIEISEQAADEILKFYKTDFDVEQKTDQTPLTAADLAAHTFIVNALTKLTPNIPVLSEESATISFEVRQTWDTYWLVDPLDGTREFIKENDEFSVNIALISNHSSILGVIFVPVSRDCYYATKDNGAYKKTAEGEFKISVKSSDVKSLTIAASRSYLDNTLDNFFKKVGDHEKICMGSSIKSCLVAEGKVDIYPRLGPTSEWDTAAAQCIVEEAGGHLTDTALKPLRYNTKKELLNPHFLVFADDQIDWLDYL